MEKKINSEENSTFGVQIPATLRCALCSKLPIDVVETQCCGCLYCWNCILKVSKCQKCSSALSPEECHHSQAISNLIQSYTKSHQITCSQGCGETMFDEDFEQHITTCPCVKIPCTNLKCTEHVKRSDLLDHLCDCLYTLVDCKYGCTTKIARADVDEHNENNLSKHLDATVKRLEALENKSQVNQMGWDLNQLTGFSNKALWIIGLIILLMVVSPKIFCLVLVLVVSWRVYVNQVYPRTHQKWYWIVGVCIYFWFCVTATTYFLVK